MNKFTTFQQNYDNAIATIKDFLCSDDCAEMRGLAAWLMETDANPYSFLPEAWANSVNTADGMAGLLHYIHHAVYDDGDICFVAVNDEPRIVFASPHDNGFRDRVLTDQEKDIEKRNAQRGMRPHNITVLDIKPNAFGEVYNKWYTGWVRDCFIADADGHGTEWAAEHYRKYSCWKEEWITECEPEIEKHRALYAPLRHAAKNLTNKK